MPFIPHTPADQRDMLQTIGAPDIDALFQDIPTRLRAGELRIPLGLSEMETLRQLDQTAARNRTGLISFLGAGFYDHYIPSAVDALCARGEFSTAYTPYQAEASQGMLQAIFEYQTAVSRLMDMDYANASLYDGGTALYEAVMMAVRHTRRTSIVISESVNPIYRIMLNTHIANLKLNLVTVPHRNCRTDTDALMAAIGGNTAAVIVQNPNFFGTIQDFTDLFATAAKHGTVSVISAYPVLQAVLKTPGQMGADIAVAEGQSLGLPLSFGGPYLGMMACSRQMVRQMPGRIAGRTKDKDANTGFVLTLQAREQHIRREKATSNICSNQALCALRALIHMSLLGPEGLRRTAGICIENAGRAAGLLEALPGVSVRNRPFGNEFTLRLPANASEITARLLESGFVAGFPLGRYYRDMDDHLLVACTEKTSPQDIGMLAELIGGAL